MQLHPTQPAIDLAWAGVVTMAVGLIARQPAILAWGGALILGVAVARAVTRVGVNRVRAAGFEMLWREEVRSRQLSRGESVELVAEVRNRDTRAARFVQLRAVASPGVELTLDPEAGEVPAQGRMRVTVTARVPRVGHHAIHGLSLEVHGSPGLFEVPLTFANPFGLEILPKSVGITLTSARGGRSRREATSGLPGPRAGHGSELRELREHQPGDPFKHIAWKASARRGTLLVREFEREERSIVWLLLDASVELWAGDPGTAPLDLAIDEVVAVASRHLAQGDRVGLAVIGARVLSRIPPEKGPQQAKAIALALTRSTGTVHADRSSLDESAVAARVLDHMRPLDPASVFHVRSSEIDRIARRAERLLERAPLSVEAPYAATPRERLLRRYLEAFGVGSPPSQEAERHRTDLQLVATLDRLAKEKPRPSVIYLWSPTPDPMLRPMLEPWLAKFPRRRIELRWVPMHILPSIPVAPGSKSRAVVFAIRERLTLSELRGERCLRHLGIPMATVGRRRSDATGLPEPRGGTEAQAMNRGDSG